MPKIKVKNIPSSTVDRICNTHPCDRTCPLYKIVQLDDGDVIRCIKDCRYGPEEAIIEFSEKDFLTNREWLESLSDEDLAAFYTLGIPLKDNSYISLYKVAMSFTSSQQGIKEWLSKPCVYLMEDE